MADYNPKLDVLTEGQAFGEYVTERAVSAFENAFDGTTNAFGRGAQEGSPYGTIFAWVDFGAGNEKTIAKIRYYLSKGAEFGSWLWWGSNNTTDGLDGDWVQLDSGNSRNVGWYEYEYVNITAYRWYRWNPTSSYWRDSHVMRHLELYEPFGGADIDVPLAQISLTGQVPVAKETQTTYMKCEDNKLKMYVKRELIWEFD